MDEDSPVASEGQARSEPDLFFPVSSDEEDEAPRRPSNARTSAKGQSSGLPSPPISREPSPKASSSRAPSEPMLFFGSPESDIVPLPSKSSLDVPSSSSAAGPSRSKRPSLSRTPSATKVPASFTGGYLGEFVCEGWSLSKGKGYCSPGSKIVFERPKPVKAAEESEATAAARSKEKLGPARLVNGKMVHAKGKPVQGKQMTLGAMMAKKAAPAVSYWLTALRLPC